MGRFLDEEPAPQPRGKFLDDEVRPDPAEPSWGQRFTSTLKGTLAEGYEAAERGQTGGKKLLQAIVPTTPIGVGSAAGMTVAGPAIRAAATRAPRAIAPALAALGRIPALGRIIGAAVGGEVGGQVEGAPTGYGTAVGGISTGLAEGAGAVAPHIARALPGLKGFFSRQHARRVGEGLEDVGVQGARTATDFADAATEAAKRRMAAEEGFRGAQAAYPAAVQAAKEEARQATARATTAQRGQQAEDIRDVIVRNVPQLGPAFEGQTGAAALRTAGAGRARGVLGVAKEEVTAALEQAAPDGIVVPSLSRPAEEAFTIGPLGNIVPAGGGAPQRMPIRDAIEELSLLGSDRTTQFARNPLDRNIQGAARRRRYGELWNEIKRGLDEAREGLGDMFAGGQASYKEGLAASKALIEPDAAYLPTGEVNLPGIASRVQKPRMRRALEEKLGPERFEQMAGEITAIPREAPRIEPALPPPPTPSRQSPADIVMSALFGPQQRILQGREALVNWPAVQKALQAPETRAQLELALGREGYQRLKAIVLRGAKSGADIPAAGSGRFGGPALDVASGREKGAGFFASALPRSFLPNFGAHYVGDAPLQLPPIVQMLIDLGAQRAGTRTER